MWVFKFNRIKILGNNNLVLQDFEGNVTQISINDFIEKFTKEQDEKIKLLESAIRDKEKIQDFTDEKIRSLSDSLSSTLKEKLELEVRIRKLIIEFNDKNISLATELFQEAFAYFTNGMLDEAILALSEEKLQSEFNKIKLIESELNDAKIKLADNYSFKSGMLLLKSETNEAEISIKKALELNPEKSDYWNTLSAIQNRNSNFTGALKSINIAIEKDSINGQSNLNNPLHLANKAQILIELAKFSEAKQQIEKAGHIANIKTEINYLSPIIFNTWAHLAYNLGEKKLALEFYEEALQAAIALNIEPKELLILKNNLGYAYHENERYDIALNYFEEVLTCYRDLGHTDLEIGGNLFFNIGCAKSGLGLKKEGLKLMIFGLQIDKKRLDKNNIQLSKYYFNIGSIIYKKNREKGYVFLKKALKIAKTVYDEPHPYLANVYYGLAIFFQKTEPPKSIKYFKEAISNRELLFGLNDAEVAHWYLYLSVSYYFNNEEENSINFYEEGWLRVKNNNKANLELLDSLHFKNSAIALSKDYMFSTSKYLINEWSGCYSYRNEDNNTQYEFTLLLRLDSNNVIKGTCIEKIGESYLIARVLGSHNLNEIEFKKTYITLKNIENIFDEDNSEILTYKGIFDENSLTYFGNWNISTSESTPEELSSGFWKMTILENFWDN